ncbi:uncharacterized protein [Argopecten irradians]|uniref:uncharacterized protein n=1 Tax=Argopecten irradians TaxID=31199 RepID=UPI003721670C
MPPMLIVRGKTPKCVYGYNCAEAPADTIWTFQERALMNEEIAEHWFRSVFLKNCGPERPQLLLLDDHGSHKSLTLLELAQQENIFILAFPPHTTHFLQALDRSVFFPFNKHYNRLCSEFRASAPCNLINKWTFSGIFRQAWEHGVTRENIISGFRGCGIFPLNPNSIPESAFLPSIPFDKSIAESISTSTATSATRVCMLARCSRCCGCGDVRAWRQ